jgi:beta-galactosidase
MPDLPRRVLFGAAYYHEYQPTDRLETDLDLMRQAHFSVIRVGESVWSTWEPEDGVFNLDWLQPVLDAAQARGISVILGTPTYAVPPWLVRLYPEITGERGTGVRIGWGARQEVDFTHPAFKFHAERVIRAILGRYAQHPAVIGFQVDNEPGLELLHNHAVFQRFVDRLRHQYGDVENLNERWGLVYWSHCLSTWADLWKPDGNAQPQYDLAWRRFQADQTTDFIGWEADLVREYAKPDQFVTTCISYERPAVDDEALTARLDIAAGNPYHVAQDALELPDDTTPRQCWKTDGVWGLFEGADRMYASRQSPYLVTETGALTIGDPWDNRPAYDGQWRQAAWAHIARGAQMIEYWQWHTLLFGKETYWGGVLPHSGEPGRVYREIAKLGTEIDAAGELISGLKPDSDVTMLYSLPSKWLMQHHPPLATTDWGPDPDAYRGLFDPFYRGAFDAGLQVRIAHVGQVAPLKDGQDPIALDQAVKEHPVLVVPGLYVAEDATLDWLGRYAAAGGHLVIGPRTAYGDSEAWARAELAPAHLRDAAGVWYDEFSNLGADIPVRPTEGSALSLGNDAAATRWVDGLVSTTADVLASYEHPHFGRWPAITSRAHGAGRVTYVGTVPNRSLARSIFSYLVPRPKHGWSHLPDTVTVATALAADGRRVHVVHNWSWERVSVTAPAALVGLKGGRQRPEGDVVELEPWDVQVFVTETSIAPGEGGAPVEGNKDIHAAQETPRRRSRT